MKQGSRFRAFTLRGDLNAQPIDPFLGVDHAWMNGPTFPAHPHAGFSAVSYLFPDSETGINNQDSLGNRNLIQPGGLHWTAAGQGVVHEEVPAEPGKTVHMLQIFINLPAHKQAEAPFVFSVEAQNVPVVDLPGAQVRVPLGSFERVVSALSLPTNVRLLDIALQSASELKIPIPEGHVAFVMPIDGEVFVDGYPFDLADPQVPVNLPQGPDRLVTLSTQAANARAVVFSGAPLHQPVHWHGPMAFASSPALAKAIEGFRRGDFGQLKAR
jgi:redox-sensitive bicupin YhaK (pirin superfamily)